jgi:hypothetical protein
MPRKSCVGPSSYSEQRVGSSVRPRSCARRRPLGRGVAAVPISGCPLSGRRSPSMREPCATSLTVRIQHLVRDGIGVLDGSSSPRTASLSGRPELQLLQWSEQMFLWLTSPAPSSLRRGRQGDELPPSSTCRSRMNPTPPSALRSSPGRLDQGLQLAGPEAPSICPSCSKRD